MNGEVLGLSVGAWFQWIMGLLIGGMVFAINWLRLERTVLLDRLRTMREQVFEINRELEGVKAMASIVPVMRDDVERVKKDVAVQAAEKTFINDRLDSICETTRDTNQKVDGLIKMLLEKG